MVYQAFYRVYRPQTFSDMSGQTHVKQTLQNALLANQTTHAYLFSGPRGTGKTSTAKIFAKALNCEHAPAEEPCNACATCLSITEGTFNDVIEFDAASNSRVEEIREVIENVRFAPAEGKFKVYIIDEVHMLSTSAFNALLKTLEEPPSHAVFILATTEPHKLPATIISRCQRFDFKRLSSQDMVERMSMILHDIQLDYDEQALKIIAQSAAGGMRDALSLLDQAVSFSQQKLEVENTLLVTGAVSQDVFTELVTYIAARDVAALLTLVEQLVSDGKDPLRLTEDLITFFRDLLLIQTGVVSEDLLEMVTLTEEVQVLAKQFETGTFYQFVDVLAKTQQEMRFSHHTKIYLETALLQMVQPPQNSNVTVDPNMSAKVVALEQMVQQLTQQLSTPQTQSTVSQPKAQKQHNDDYKAPIGRIKQVMQSASRPALNRILELWPQIMSQLQRSEAARFEDTEVVAASERAFVLKCKYPVHCKLIANETILCQNVGRLLAVENEPYEILCIHEAEWLTLRDAFVKEFRAKKGTTEEPTTDDVIETPAQDQLVAEAEKLFGNDFIEVFDD
ncbi:DNA polymerase III subunit gamma/tau [Lysinibacillus alkalisoli]|uniref:DNA-directed DNA polymerase n=1 Tax=Lysinibacillus alkalisoli TaxID=1911548 RepID=A0A917GAP0_9BACI|nr:DNA polymerase III subunit gamma/tau [Lysinibacillus alkalisoli]GGG33938.1 DNA polymerase III subunit gamma/tau [Lysinibacillus alkalisoli]